METATSAAIAINKGRRRREVDPAWAWLLDSSILGMDFQPVLAKKFGLGRVFRSLSYGGDFGGCYLACLYATRMLSNVVQPGKRVNETIVSVQFLAYLSNVIERPEVNDMASGTPNIIR